MNCPRCGSENNCKNGLNKGNQRYLCKDCKYTYSTSKYRKNYSDAEKKEALRYHNEGNGFRRIERLLGMSHNSVINWVKKASQQIQYIVKKRKFKKKLIF